MACSHRTHGNANERRSALRQQLTSHARHNHRLKWRWTSGRFPHASGMAVTHWWCRPTMLHSSICNPTRARRHVRSAPCENKTVAILEQMQAGRPASSKRWRRNAYCHCPWQATSGRADAPVQPVIVNGQRGVPTVATYYVVTTVQYKCYHHGFPWLTCASLILDTPYTLWPLAKITINMEKQASGSPNCAGSTLLTNMPDEQ